MSELQRNTRVHELKDKMQRDLHQSEQNIPNNASVYRENEEKNGGKTVEQEDMENN